MAINTMKLIIGSCGCMSSIYTPLNPIIAPYVSFESSRNVFDSEYYPYTAFEDDNIFFVPENYEEMQEARKFSDLEDAPGITAFDKFVGFYTDPDTGIRQEYLYSPELLFADVIDQTTYRGIAATADITTVINERDTLTNAWFLGKNIQEIVTNQQNYLSVADFIQTGSSIRWLVNSWDDGQAFRAKL